MGESPAVGVTPLAGRQHEVTGLTELVQEAKEAVQKLQSETDTNTDFRQLAHRGLREKKEASNHEAQLRDSPSILPSQRATAARNSM